MRWDLISRFNFTTFYVCPKLEAEFPAQCVVVFTVSIMIWGERLFIALIILEELLTITLQTSLRSDSQMFIYNIIVRT